MRRSGSYVLGFLPEEGPRQGGLVCFSEAVGAGQSEIEGARIRRGRGCWQAGDDGVMGETMERLRWGIRRRRSRRRRSREFEEEK